ncbi:hypothetical protein GCM10023322_36850 [Rugosimonospora acidiphila]|uniref:AAA+ ATPase domain-containing protein n=1 Tax=Rugosimonospora acidiphila TaxID=556531 RepID=A0ABP9RWD3_9ACTN
MRRVRISRTTGAILVFLVSAGPAVLVMPSHIRLVVALVACAGWLLGYLLVRLLGTGLLTDPSWRRPRRMLAARRGRPRREYVVPTEIPPPPGLLIGRDAQVRAICDHLVRPGVDGPRVVVLTGPAGVGKSALAIGVAQVLADRYRDGQLLARLDRAAPGEQGIDDVLSMFVEALQDPSDAPPTTAAGRLRRYRELTASRRVLVILESVDDAERVRRLLPPGRGCAVILTAHQALSLDESWLAVPVERLSEEAALRVLDALVGDGRVEAEPVEARRIVEATAGQPFALQIAGAALASRRNWTLKVAVSRMREARLSPAPPDALPDFAAALDLSYALLTEQERRGLTMLGLIDEPTFAPWMLSALLADEATDAVAERILDRLVYARLVERRLDDATGVATFRVGTQIGRYVRARLSADVPPEVRERAAGQLARARRLHTARSPEDLLRVEVYRQLQNGELSAALNTARAVLKLCRERVEAAAVATREGGPVGRPGGGAAGGLAVADAREELARARAEEGLALAALAEVNGELGWMEDSRQYAEQALATQTDPCRPRALRCLGTVHVRAGRIEAAQRCLDDAVPAARMVGDRWEIVRTLRDLAMILSRRGRHDGARATVEEALDRCRADEDAARRRRPGVLLALGAVLRAAGDPDGADRALDEAEGLAGDHDLRQGLWLPWIRHERALVAMEQRRYGRGREHALRASAAFRDMNHRYGIAHCRMTIGRAYLAEGNEQATPILEEAVQTFVGCGDRWIEAECRCWLGEAHLSARRLDAAAEAFARAAQDFHDLGDLPSRGRARGRLAATDARRRWGAVEENVMLRVARPLVGLRVRAD